MPTLISFDYFFWVVALGTMALGFVSGVVGTTIVLEKQSQLGDAIGHAVYPGVIFAFMLFQTRHTFVLIAGAILAGLLAFGVIAFIRKRSHFSYESILALVLSSFFSVGLLLYNIVQNNPKFQSVNFAGLDNFIMGQAAFMMQLDVQTIVVVSLIILSVFFILYPRIKLTLFDKVFAESIGINSRRISNILLLMCLLVIAIGLQAVGAKLISSFLVAPAVAAQQWTKSYPKMIGLAGFFGMLAAFIGTFLSTVIADLATGPVIVVVLTLITLGSIVLGSNGIVASFVSSERKEVTNR